MCCSGDQVVDEPARHITAGALALILSARKNDGLTVPQARALMMSTSLQAPSTYQGSLADTVTLQGAGKQKEVTFLETVPRPDIQLWWSRRAGVINAQRAVESRTLVSPAQIMLNDTQYFKGLHTITLDNREAVAVTYTLSNVNARAVATYNNVSDFIRTFEATSLIDSVFPPPACVERCSRVDYAQHR